MRPHPPDGADKGQEIRHGSRLLYLFHELVYSGAHFADSTMHSIQRGSMNIQTKAIAAVILAAGFTSVYAHAADPAPAPAEKKHAKHDAKPKPVPSATAAELQELKQEMETQINTLKEQLSDRDVQLKQAQDAAAAAQASAARAEAAANSQQQAVTENAAAVSTLNSTVTDIKSN
jgi:hypothetical protein